MKYLLMAFLFVLMAPSVSYAAAYVNPYSGQDNTSSQGYYRNDSNNTIIDNYGSQRNSNSYNDQDDDNNRSKDFPNQQNSSGHIQSPFADPKSKNRSPLAY